MAEDITRVQFRWGPQAEIEDAPIIDGYIYFATDTMVIYLDKDNVRHTMYPLVSYDETSLNGNDGMMSVSDKIKLDGIEEKANRGVKELTAGAGIALKVGTKDVESIEPGKSGIIRTRLKSETPLSQRAQKATGGVNRTYPLELDADENLATVVPWIAYEGESPISIDGSTIRHDASGVTASSYGPASDVTGSNNTTIKVPQITVNAKGHVTSVTDKIYTSVDHTYTKLPNPSSITLKGNGTTLENGVYDGSEAKVVNITPAAIGALPVDGIAVAAMTATTASQMAASHNWSITGGATAAAQPYDGTQNVVLNVTRLDATKLNGQVPTECLPPTAQQQVWVVADDTERYALSSNDVHVGDIVIVEDDNKMYLVIDTTKLNQSAGYKEFGAGVADRAEKDLLGNAIHQTYVSRIAYDGNQAAFVAYGPNNYQLFTFNHAWINI